MYTAARTRRCLSDSQYQLSYTRSVPKASRAGVFHYANAFGIEIADAI